MPEPRPMSLAEQADRHRLYQEAVQDVEAEIDFVLQTWNDQRNRPPRLLREDFCGTAATACEWVRRDPAHRALAVDQDPEVLAWGRAHNVATLSEDQRARITLLQADVRDVVHTGIDIVLAMNFSYYLLMERAAMIDYYRSVRDSLAPDGMFFLDAYGGYEAPQVLTERRECEGFTYIWDQASFNPIDSRADCHIHFEFPDGSRIERAFSYCWRLWTLPEIREMLTEAGFREVAVYWEGTDEETGEGNGIYTPSEVGDADPGWVCYVIAQD